MQALRGASQADAFLLVDTSQETQVRVRTPICSYLVSVVDHQPHCIITSPDSCAVAAPGAMRAWNLTFAHGEFDS